jgi:ribonuclease PH
MAGKVKIRRPDSRRPDELRPVKITTGFLRSADGSCLMEAGETRIICTASIERAIPEGRDPGLGWITAEYSMLPASTGRRRPRKQDGRGTEIQRLIGRSMRSIARFEKMPDMTVFLDCDVIQADGGTRTASITGAYVALAEAMKNATETGLARPGALKGAIAAVSVGIVDSTPLLDLCYEEDSRADVDMNLAMTSGGKFVEIQGTSEGNPFTSQELEKMLRLGRKGIRRLLQYQKEALQ